MWSRLLSCKYCEIIFTFDEILNCHKCTVINFHVDGHFSSHPTKLVMCVHPDSMDLREYRSDTVDSNIVNSKLTFSSNFFSQLFPRLLVLPV